MNKKPKTLQEQNKAMGKALYKTRTHDLFDKEN
jgi:hypothetical protein